MFTGYNNSLANAFARHAAKLQPRLIVLIVPPETLVPDGYIKLCDERTVMEHRWVAEKWLPNLSIWV